MYDDLSEDVGYLKRHPTEMFWLSITEMCQRFAFWGVGNLLVLYLIQFYELSTPTATHIYGFFTGIGFLLPVLGGYLTDRWNYKSPIILGFVLTALGCFLLSTTIYAFMFPALICIAIGGGVFTPCIYALLGKAYHGKHHLREIGFSIYYAAVNLGVFLAMIVLGLLIQLHGWKTVFITAGLVQILGLLAFQKAIGYFPKEQLKITKKKKGSTSKPLTTIEKHRLIVILAFCAITLFFWAAYSQNGSSMVLFAYKFTDRAFFDLTIPTPWILSVETLFLLILVIPMTMLYLYLRKREIEPSPPMKTVLGMIAMGLSFLVMVLASEQVPAGASKALVSPWYVSGAFIIMSVGELLMAPISLSLVTNLSPKRFTAFFVGIWYLCIGIAYYFGGLIAGLVASMKLTSFFSIFVYTCFAIALATLLFAKKLNAMRHIEHLHKEEG